ncbi:MAG TPA: YicC family protein [Flavobacteriales bacterium]|nr:YicC family protein [Flavobacteriales bacterium]
MLRSMTGFGRAEGQIGGKKVTVELRSLNSKQLDLLVKLPTLWRDKEAELRSWATEHVVRGKAELGISVEGVQAQKRTAFNPGLVQSYYDELHAMAQRIAPNAQTDLLGLVLRLPDVMTTAREEYDPAEWAGVQQLVDQAWNAFDQFRLAEGAKLKAELAQRTANISALLAGVEAMDAGRIERTRGRIRAKLEELQAKVDQDRFEQELVYYIEKLDVTEEKLRLATHCNYFLETMEQEEGQGRKLSFISQEMGREINTLGSKANDADMQKRVVLMKDELEKIKEQVLNVL